MNEIKKLRSRRPRAEALKAPSHLFADLSLRDPSLPEPTLDRTVQDRIGHELRAMYADLERQPIPERFLELLNRLEAGGGEKTS